MQILNLQLCRGNRTKVSIFKIQNKINNEKSMKKIHFHLDKMNAGLNFVPTNLEFNPAIHFGQFWTKMVNQIKIGINKKYSSLI